MFTRLGRKIIEDSRRTATVSRSAVDDSDDAFIRFTGSEDPYDVMYHGGGHGHSHDHGHGEEMTDDERYEKAMYQLKCVTVVGLIFVSAQGVGAYLANSIAIATDCAHLATDLLAFVMSIIALALTRRGESKEYTFGWHRAEIIGSLFSIIFLIILTIWLLIEALKRCFMDYDIEGEIMLVTAVLSLFFNLILINILHQGPGHDHDHDHDHDHLHDTTTKCWRFGGSSPWMSHHPSGSRQGHPRDTGPYAEWPWVARSTPSRTKTER